MKCDPHRGGGLGLRAKAEFGDFLITEQAHQHIDPGLV
jgi:hypothetical protein